MSAVVELSCHSEIEEAGGIDGQNLEAEWIFFDSFYTEFIGRWNSIILIQCFCFYAENVDVLLRDEGLKYVVSSDIFP